MSNDTIYRQDAIDEIEYELEMINSALDSITLDFNARERLRQRRGEAREILNSIQQLPSAQPERKKGEWIKKISKKEKDKEYIGYTPYWYCSECGKRYEPALANTIINYCYNCGADMRGE